MRQQPTELTIQRTAEQQVAQYGSEDLVGTLLSISPVLQYIESQSNSESDFSNADQPTIAERIQALQTQEDLNPSEVASIVTSAYWLVYDFNSEESSNLDEKDKVIVDRVSLELEKALGVIDDKDKQTSAIAAINIFHRLKLFASTDTSPYNNELIGLIAQKSRSAIESATEFFDERLLEIFEEELKATSLLDSSIAKSIEKSRKSLQIGDTQSKGELLSKFLDSFEVGIHKWSFIRVKNKTPIRRYRILATAVARRVSEVQASNEEMTLDNLQELHRVHNAPVLYEGMKAFLERAFSKKVSSAELREYFPELDSEGSNEDYPNPYAALESMLVDLSDLEEEDYPEGYKKLIEQYINESNDNELTEKPLNDYLGIDLKLLKEEMSETQLKKHLATEIQQAFLRSMARYNPHTAPWRLFCKEAMAPETSKKESTSYLPTHSAANSILLKRESKRDEASVTIGLDFKQPKLVEHSIHAAIYSTLTVGEEVTLRQGEKDERNRPKYKANMLTQNLYNEDNVNSRDAKYSFTIALENKNGEAYYIKISKSEASLMRFHIESNNPEQYQIYLNRILSNKSRQTEFNPADVKDNDSFKDAAQIIYYKERDKTDKTQELELELAARNISKEELIKLSESDDYKSLLYVEEVLRPPEQKTHSKAADILRSHKGASHVLAIDANTQTGAYNWVSEYDHRLIDGMFGANYRKALNDYLLKKDFFEDSRVKLPKPEKRRVLDLLVRQGYIPEDTSRLLLEQGFELPQVLDQTASSERVSSEIEVRRGRVEALQIDKKVLQMHRKTIVRQGLIECGLNSLEILELEKISIQRMRDLIKGKIEDPSVAEISLYQKFQKVKSENKIKAKDIERQIKISNNSAALNLMGIAARASYMDALHSGYEFKRKKIDMSLENNDKDFEYAAELLVQDLNHRSITENSLIITASQKKVLMDFFNKRLLIQNDILSIKNSKSLDFERKKSICTNYSIQLEKSDSEKKKDLLYLVNLHKSFSTTRDPEEYLKTINDANIKHCLEILGIKVESQDQGRSKLREFLTKFDSELTDLNSSKATNYDFISFVNNYELSTTKTTRAIRYEIEKKLDYMNKRLHDNPKLDKRVLSYLFEHKNKKYLNGERLKEISREMIKNEADASTIANEVLSISSMKTLAASTHLTEQLFTVDAGNVIQKDIGSALVELLKDPESNMHEILKLFSAYTTTSNNKVADAISRVFKNGYSESSFLFEATRKLYHQLFGKVMEVFRLNSIEKSADYYNPHGLDLLDRRVKELKKSLRLDREKANEESIPTLNDEESKAYLFIKKTLNRLTQFTFNAPNLIEDNLNSQKITKGLKYLDISIVEAIRSMFKMSGGITVSDPNSAGKGIANGSATPAQGTGTLISVILANVLEAEEENAQEDDNGAAMMITTPPSSIAFQMRFAASMQAIVESLHKASDARLNDLS